MAYNLQSLIMILEKILNPDQKRWILDHESRPQIDSLLEKASSLKQILENSSSPTNGQRESLESRIRDASHKAEDIIESHIVDRMLSKRGATSCSISPPDLQQVIEELDSAKDQMMKTMDTAASDPNQMVKGSLPSSAGSGSFKPDPITTNTVVGLDKDLHQLKDRLTGHETKLEIIPIVGMGGIGKTTLAQKLYNDEHMVSHFDHRAWVTVSQAYNVRKILLDLLGCLVGKLTDEILQKENRELSDIIYKRLWGKRYLIVLDDLWSANAWDDIKWFVPKDNNRCRIILTTRETEVANHVDALSEKHQMHLLNEPESWGLLREKVFGKEDCPASLEMIGKNIASRCKGLPLAISVIGGLLSKAKKTEDSWKHVADDIKDDQLSNILSLSYNHLPDHLKPCFLYIGAFPEDHEIRTSKLVNLWVAEGFLKSNGDKILEEAAEDYLKALADRNLLFVRQIKSNGKAKSYGIHDLLRDLCLKKADHEKFLKVQNHHVYKARGHPLHHTRRLSIHASSFSFINLFSQQKFMSLARTFLCIGFASSAFLSPVFFRLRLLRVLDVLDIEYHQFPEEIWKLVNLRYLAFSCNTATVPSDVSRLWNLQTLIIQSVQGFMGLPNEIWEMSELRHLKVKNKIISIIYFGVLEKLQTISTIYWNWTDEFVAISPNIKKLGICIQYEGIIIDLRELPKLETLKCSSVLLRQARNALSDLRLPPPLKKLTLIECTIPWGFTACLGSLDNLEVLKIKNCAFEGEETDDNELWDATEKEFGSLKFLLLENLKMVHWQADETCFPRLERLIIRGCSALEEIPCGIGDIPTLEMIELDESCSPSAVASARQIQEDQRDYGNEGIQVRVVP